MAPEMSDDVPVVTIVRDHQCHCWVYEGLGAHRKEIPWSDETPADVVIRDLKTRANGRLIVHVNLG